MGEGLRHFIVSAHQGAVDLAELELPPGVLQGAVERDAFVGIGGVVSVVLGFDGHQRADGVVGRLHEVSRLQQLFPFGGQGVEEQFRVFDAAITCAGDDGINGFQASRFKGLFRGD